MKLFTRQLPSNKFLILYFQSLCFLIRDYNFLVVVINAIRVVRKFRLVTALDSITKWKFVTHKCMSLSCMRQCHIHTLDATSMSWRRLQLDWRFFFLILFFGKCVLHIPPYLCFAHTPHPTPHTPHPTPHTPHPTPHTPHMWTPFLPRYCR